jgi:hypothetical protein
MSIFISDIHLLPSWYIYVLIINSDTSCTRPYVKNKVGEKCTTLTHLALCMLLELSISQDEKESWHELRISLLASVISSFIWPRNIVRRERGGHLMSHDTQYIYIWLIETFHIPVISYLRPFISASFQYVVYLGLHVLDCSWRFIGLLKTQSYH